MPQTPDRRNGPLYEDEYISLGTSSVDSPAADGEVRYVSGSGFRFQERGFIRTLYPQSNVTSSVAPTAFDGYNKGYEPGSVWITTSSQQAYMLVDPTSGSSVWKNVTSASSGITDTDHKTLRQLIHFINEGPGDGFYSNPFREIVGGLFPSRVTWWSDSGKTIRLFQTEVTRSGIYPVTQSYKMYASNGVTLLAVATDVIAYNGAFEVARSRSFA